MNEERHCTKCGGKLPANAPQGLCPQCLMELGLPTSNSPENNKDTSGNNESTGRFVPPEISDLEEQFPQIEIIELLGQGGMGAVYKARQKQLDRLVALKILPPQTGQTESFAERFTREARSLARLNHSHIVTVYDFGHTEEGLYFFIMEFVDGTDLRRVIQAGELSEKQALSVVPQICDALQYAHEEGIVHRDIKPENILMNKKGQVKIADFGLAKLLDRPATAYTLTKAGQRMGTPHYMAPEQIEHPGQVDHRADIYSLGVVFYEMLTGELPLGHFPLPSRKVHVDVRLDEVVLKTLEKEPEMRYQYASEVKTAVETISTGKATGAPKRNAFKTYKTNSLAESARQRVWIPAIGLMITGGINCLAVIGAIFTFFHSMIRGGLDGRFISFRFIPGIFQLMIVCAIAAYSIYIIYGGWNLMQLRSHRTAFWGSILALFPFSPGAILGIPMGIWALVLLSKDEIKNVFGQEETEVSIPPQVRQFAVSAVGQVKETFEREKAEFKKLRTQKTPAQRDADTETVDNQLGMPIASCILGLISIVSAGMGVFFGFTFPLVFLSIMLGVISLTKIKKIHQQPVQFGLALGGILLGVIAAITTLSML